jgi:hypothetical protein
MPINDASRNNHSVSVNEPKDKSLSTSLLQQQLKDKRVWEMSKLCQKQYKDFGYFIDSNIRTFYELQNSDARKKQMHNMRKQENAFKRYKATTAPIPHQKESELDPVIFIDPDSVTKAPGPDVTIAADDGSQYNVIRDGGFDADIKEHYIVDEYGAIKKLSGGNAEGSKIAYYFYGKTGITSADPNGRSSYMGTSLLDLKTGHLDVGFKGSRSGNVRITESARGTGNADWATDLGVRYLIDEPKISKNGHVCEGFAKSYLSCERALATICVDANRKANAEQKNLQITTTGHSLGGALCTNFWSAMQFGTFSETLAEIEASDIQIIHGDMDENPSGKAFIVTPAQLYYWDGSKRTALNMNPGDLQKLNLTEEELPNRSLLPSEIQKIIQLTTNPPVIGAELGSAPLFDKWNTICKNSECVSFSAPPTHSTATIIAEDAKSKCVRIYTDDDIVPDGLSPLMVRILPSPTDKDLISRTVKPAHIPGTSVSLGAVVSPVIPSIITFGITGGAAHSPSEIEMKLADILGKKITEGEKMWITCDADLNPKGWAQTSKFMSAHEYASLAKTINFESELTRALFISGDIEKNEKYRTLIEKMISIQSILKNPTTKEGEYRTQLGRLQSIKEQLAIDAINHPKSGIICSLQQINSVMLACFEKAGHKLLDETPQHRKIVNLEEIIKISANYKSKIQKQLFSYFRVGYKKNNIIFEGTENIINALRYNKIEEAQERLNAMRDELKRYGYGETNFWGKKYESLVAIESIEKCLNSIKIHKPKSTSAVTIDFKTRSAAIIEEHRNGSDETNDAAPNNPSTS